MLFKAIGFAIFALATQFIAGVSGIDLLEDFNVFALPMTMFFLVPDRFREKLKWNGPNNRVANNWLQRMHAEP